MPHISLVFREMWETTNLDVFADLRKRHMECSGLPHLAKNERDMGHPTILGREKEKTGRKWRELLWICFASLGGAYFDSPVILADHSQQPGSPFHNSHELHSIRRPGIITHAKQ